MDGMVCFQTVFQRQGDKDKQLSTLQVKFNKTECEGTV